MVYYNLQMKFNLNNLMYNNNIHLYSFDRLRTLSSLSVSLALIPCQQCAKLQVPMCPRSLEQSDLILESVPSSLARRLVSAAHVSKKTF